MCRNELASVERRHTALGKFQLEFTVTIEIKQLLELDLSADCSRHRPSFEPL